MSSSAQDLPGVEQRSRTRSPVSVWIGIALAVAALAGVLVAFFWRGQRAKGSRSRTLSRPPLPQAVLDLQGLTEEDAAARRLDGQDNAIHFKPLHSKREIVRANTLTIFNLSMVGLAVVQILLGKPFDAVLTTIVLALGIGLNVGQELWARGRLRKLGQATRTQATVVREGTVRSIDPANVVRGDILVVGTGDQILADGQVLGEGQFLVDESMLTGDPRQHTKRAGDPVYAGSFCLAGHGAYEAQKVGSERLIVALTGEFEAIEEELTPLERTIDRLLRVLLIVVTLLALFLLADYFDLLLPSIHVDAFASAASVIFGLAPASLFLMIVVNYAMGTAYLARVGALVHRYRSVESLAQATVVCFAQDGILTGMGVQVEPVKSRDDTDGESRTHLAESRVRQVLGDLARSGSAQVPGARAMEAAFPGNRRHVREEAPFFSLYGWSAVAFDDTDLRGVYVVGEPEVLKAHLSQDARESQATDHLQPIAWRRGLTNLGRALGLAGNGTEIGQRPAVEEEPQGDGALGDAVVALEGSSVPALLQRFVKRVEGSIRREAAAPGEGETGAQERVVEEVVYLIAYHPDLMPLHAPDGTPCLPDDLIPLCRLCFSAQVRPEAVETVRSFARNGVGIKVLSSDAPERTAALLGQSSLGGTRDPSLGSTRDPSLGGDGAFPAISGPELAALDEERLVQASVENTIFGQVTPEQAGEVVAALRGQGEVVAVVGDGVNDLGAMRQAQLSITRQRSSPAVLSVADIVLLENAQHALVTVLDRGQRIANGLLDILKLYLVQITYLLLLILVLWGAGLGFPYQSKQGSLITIVSVILPSLGLSLWAPPGVVPRRHLGWLLARFVAPVAVLISAAAVVVYLYFSGTTRGVTYAQLATTYMLVISGLVVVVLLRPPVRPRMGGDARSGDWRPTALVLVLLVLLFLVAPLPLADTLFGFKPLRQPADYLVIGLAVLAWASAAILLWRVAPLKRLGPWFRSPSEPEITTASPRVSRAGLSAHPSSVPPDAQRPDQTFGDGE